MKHPTSDSPEVRCTFISTGTCRTLEWFVFPEGGLRVVTVPVLVAVIEHPSRGVILFDTGYTRRFLAATRHLPHAVYRLTVSLSIRPDQTAAAQLERRGIRPQEVGWIIMSHFDPDHCGGLRDFPAARIVCSREAWEWTQAPSGPLLVKLRLLPGHLPEEVGDRLYLLDEPSGPAVAGVFPSTDLFGDGSIKIIALPGHAPGQIGAVLRLENGLQLLLAADACYSREALRGRERWRRGPHHLWAYDRERGAETFRRLTAAIESPGLVVVPTHCREAGRELLGETAGLGEMDERRGQLRVLFLQSLPIPRPGVMQLAAVLQQAGHLCRVMVVSAEKDPVGTARRWEPQLLALSCMTGEHREMLQLAAKLRAAIPGLVVAMGGPHPTAWPQVLEHPALDIICRGEGEEALVELVERLAAGAEVTEIANLWVKTDGGVRRNPMRPPIQDLDRLPFFAREVYPDSKLSSGHPMVLTGRGCPFDCAFCVNPTLRKLYGLSKSEYARRRSPESVLEELEELMARHSVQVVEFIDDTFTLDHRWLRAFLPEYRQRIGRPFVCDVRADTLDAQTVRALREAGCTAVRMGVESGSERIRQQVLRKNLSTAAIRRANRLVKSEGIRLMTYNVVGVPGESLDEALETLCLNRELRPDYAWCGLLQPFPGTAIRDTARACGLLPNDSDIDHFPQSFFTVSLLNTAERPAMESLQRLFDLFVRVPLPLLAVRAILRSPPTRLHDFLFKLSYAGYVRKIEGVGVLEVLRTGLSSHRRMVNRKSPG
ncbi:MAG: MBL fold metallo-hydrolase [Deltaproteobacteria bacterium]|nr:MBL fold metallo-hydrolase [Deltaproteobacteria bacterium]